MRLIIWLAIPLGVMSAALMVTIILNIANHTDACVTWMSVFLPYCR